MIYGNAPRVRRAPGLRITNESNTCRSHSGVLSIHADASPSLAIVDACLRTESAAPAVRYTPIDAGAIEVVETSGAKKTITLLHREKDTVGTWEEKRPAAFDVIFNGKETRLTDVIRLNKKHAPAPVSLYEALWGLADDGTRSYICATFTFDGLGKSGRFQNARGLYLFERGKRSKVPFYTAGNITVIEK